MNGTIAASMAGVERPALTVRGGEVSGISAIIDKAVPQVVMVLADARR